MSMPDNARKRPEYEPDGYAAPKQQGDDPLAELARLIGQSDPFAEQPGSSRKAAPTLRADSRAAPEWLSRPAQPHPDDQPYDDYRASGHQGGHYADDQYQQPHSAQPFPSLFPGAGRDTHAAAIRIRTTSRRTISLTAAITSRRRRPATTTRMPTTPRTATGRRARRWLRRAAAAATRS
jgi:hypothetical protein